MIEKKEGRKEGRKEIQYAKDKELYLFVNLSRKNNFLGVFFILEEFNKDLILQNKNLKVY